MVLEGIVAELLNRYIGDYVENLDPKQLNLGIWGGDVKLSNLKLKSSALDDLDLPFKVTHGRLSKLILKIPWKNLYKQPVLVTVQGLYLVAVPNAGVAYNPEKEEKETLEAKERELRRLEDANRIRREAANGASGQGDGFVEKLATAVIKNLQIDISDIHIRFEDAYSCPSNPFACGITLKKLNFVTTNEDWLGEAITDASKFVNKLVSLEALSFYWTPDMAESYNDMSEDERTNAFFNNIAEKDRMPPLSYVLEPIHLSSQLRLNPKPENDGTNFRIPKVDLQLALQTLSLSVTRRQYEGILLFVDALDTMTLKAKYRKYEPPAQKILAGGKARDWWNYAQRCVLDGEVKPRLRSWSWAHIKAHREKLKRYRKMYTQKLINTKPAQSILSDIALLERDLSVFNILLMRQQAEVDAKKLKPPESQQNVGWWGWMTGKGKAAAVGEGDLEHKLAEIMTPDEKKKLYEAIDYHEGAPIAVYPKPYIENQFDIRLSSLSISVVDDSTKGSRNTIMVFALNGVQSLIQQRPSAAALKVQATISTISVLGTERHQERPEIMVSANDVAMNQDAGALLDVLFETKPLDSEKEYRIKVTASPVRAIYDAETINGVTKFFRPPEALQLKQVQVAAVAKFQELKESSTAGLRFAVETHKEIDLNVHLNASYLIVPEYGLFSPENSNLVIDFGDLRMRNIDVKRGGAEIKEESFYDRYSISIERIQVIFAEPKEDWMSARKSGDTPMHLLRPLSCTLVLDQCILQNDARYPLIRTNGELAAIDVRLTDKRLLRLAHLGVSIPFPEPAPAATEQENSRLVYQNELRREALSLARVQNDLKVAQALYDDHPDEGFLEKESSVDEDDGSSFGDSRSADITESGEIFFDAVDSLSGSPVKTRSFLKSVQERQRKKFRSDEVNFTTFQMQFSIERVSLAVSRGSNNAPLLELNLKHFIMELITRTFDMEAKLALADLVVDYYAPYTGDKIHLIHRHESNPGTLLLQLDYRAAKPSAPNFLTTYNNTVTALTADFMGLHLNLDREALVELKQFGKGLQAEIASIMPVDQTAKSGVSEVDSEKIVASKSDNLTPGVILMDIKAQLHTLTFSLCTGKRELAFCALREVSAEIRSDSEKMVVKAQLKRIKLKYPTPLGLYTHIVRSLTDEVLSVHYIGYNEPALKQEENSYDMAVSLNLGAVEVVFLNKFVVDISDFFANFQTAQAKLFEATAAARETAMKSVQAAYQDAVRIKMDINIRAPVVYMPQHSRSPNALLVDLGTLTLTNRFSFIETAVLDEMRLDFSAVRLSRVIMAQDGVVGKEITLLSQPQPMELTVIRNLSSWYQAVPDLSVVGGLKSLEMRLSKYDYATILAILAENFAEGGPPPVKTPVMTPETPSLPELPGIPQKAPEAQQSDVLTKIKLRFAVGTISARLYLTDLPDSRHKERLDKTEALCGLDVETLVAEVEMMNDGSMVVVAKMKDLALDDLRSKTSRVSRNRKMLERKKSGAGGDNMLLFEMKQDPAGDKFIDVIVANCQANLAMSFYLGILEFVTTAAPQEGSKQSDSIFEVSELGTSISIVEPGLSPSPFRAGVAGRQISQATMKSTPKNVQPVRPVNNMRINVNVLHPEIILIENPSVEDSRVLVVKTEVTFVMNTTPDVTTMDLSCKDLQIFLASYLKWNEQLKPILSPVTLGMHGTTPFGGKQKIAVTMGFLNLTVSPVAVQTISGVLAGMSPVADQEVRMDTTDDHHGLWKSRPLDRDKLWFLNYSLDEEEWVDINIENAIEDVTSDAFSSGDQLTLTTESIVVIFESTYGPRTIPMLLLEAKLNCVIDDFSSKMHCIGTLQMEMAYYNDLYDVWESLLEPVEDVGKKGNRPWQVQFDVKKNLTANESVQSLAKVAAVPSGTPIRRSSSHQLSGQLSSSTSLSSISAQTEALKSLAAMSITITSMDQLNLTVSSKTLDVLSKMSESFTAAISNTAVIKFAESSAPYVVYNETGVDLVLGVPQGVLKFVDSRTEMTLSSGQRADLFLAEHVQQITASVLRMQDRMSIRPPMIKVRLGDAKSKPTEILVSRAETRFYLIENITDQSRPYRLIAEILSEMGHKRIVLRSHMRLENLLPVSISVYSGNNEKEQNPLGTGRVNEASGMMNIPIPVVQHYDTSSLCWKPEHLGFLHASPKISLRDGIEMARDKIERLVQCDAKMEAGKKNDSFLFNLFVVSTPVRYGNTHTTTPNSIDYKLQLKPIFSVANLLPVELLVRVDKSQAEPVLIEPGASQALVYGASKQASLVFRIANFASKDWTCLFPLTSLMDQELVSLPMTDGNETLNLGMRAVREQGTTFLTIYAPVWILNKTGLKLSYKDPLIEEREDFGNLPILFGGKTVNSKKKLAIKAPDSDWSDKFSLDTVGSSGVLVCHYKSDNGKATPQTPGTVDERPPIEFGITIKPSAGILTRLAIITPYYVLKNDSDVTIGIREEDPSATWIPIPPQSCLPFWPKFTSGLLCCRVEELPEKITSAITYKSLQTVLLRLNNKYGGIYIQTQVTEANITTSFNLYRPGTAAALLINDTRKATVQFKQQVYDQYSFLPPQSQLLFSWNVPALEKLFVWKIDEVSETAPLDLNKDTTGIIYLNDREPVYWVSFLDGLQRVLLLTDNNMVAAQCARSLENEISNIEVTLEMNNIGLSLVDNKIKKEILYIGIVSPGAVWNGRRVGASARRYKPLSGSEARALEKAYEQYLALRERDRSRRSLQSTYSIQQEDVEVNFDINGPTLMIKPKAKELQRKYEPGLWCRYRSSDHHTQVHVKLHKMQIDNPISGSRYQVVLFPSPPPSSAEYKPFMELSLVLRNAEKSAVTQYKLATFLIQEFEFRLDQAFLNALLGFFSGESTNTFKENQKMLNNFKTNDLAEIGRNLEETVVKGFGEERVAYYEKLMLQPIKIHLSFSLSGGRVEKQSGSMAMPAEFISLFIKSIGVTITEANDVVLRLGTFERDYRFISQKQLTNEVISHYTTQVVKQVYMLVFGLDILGNPFGLVRGITDGVKDLFYEPYLGAVEGPEEFMVGLGSGFKNFVGSTLGGTMGAFGRVTGTLGRAVAALSFDEEFQERRQAELNRTGGDFAGGMASSGRHLVTGIVEGVTGVVRRPLEGAKEDGVEGFVKGLGKGLLGFIARPTTGLIDFASGSLNTIGRAVKGDNTVEWLRPPRFIPSDGIIRPYNYSQAEGGLIFNSLNGGEYTRTDEYAAHLVTSRDRRYILMLTNKRVICLEKGDVIHDWNVEWSFQIADMPEPPNLDDKGLCVYISDTTEGRPLGGLFHKTKKSKRVFIEDRDAGKWFCQKVTALWKIAKDVS